VALIYGANFSIAKVVLDDGYILPFGFILLRVTSGMILFAIFHSLFIKEKIIKKDWPLFILCGFLGMAFNQLCFFKGLKMTNPINGGLIMTLTPIMVLMSAAIFLKEKITLQKIVGVLLGSLGAVILVLAGEDLSTLSTQSIGDLLILANAALFGLYLVVAKILLKRYHPITGMRWGYFFGFIFVIPFGWNELMLVSWDIMPGHVSLATLYVLLFTTFFAYLLNGTALQHLNATIVSMYIYLQPVFTTLIALSFGTDVLTGNKIISAILIFLGVFIVSSKPFFASKNQK